MLFQNENGDIVIILTSDNADIDSATHGIDTTMPHCGIVANANAREYNNTSLAAVGEAQQAVAGNVYSEEELLNDVMPLRYGDKNE